MAYRFHRFVFVNSSLISSSAHLIESYKPISLADYTPIQRWTVVGLFVTDPTDRSNYWIIIEEMAY